MEKHLTREFRTMGKMVEKFDAGQGSQAKHLWVTALTSPSSIGAEVLAGERAKVWEEYFEEGMERPEVDEDLFDFR